MANEYSKHQNRRWYAQLIRLYPKAYRERFGEGMEQTFHDLLRERERSGGGVRRLVLWMFLDTAVSAFRERLQQVGNGDFMNSSFRTFTVSALLGFLLVLPLMIMQAINRRHLNEEFPFVLFLGLWLFPVAICLFLLPIVRAWRMRTHDIQRRILPQRGALANPRWVAMISIVLILIPVTRSLLDSLGWEPLARLFSGPNPEVDYLPGQIIRFGLGLFPVAAGIIAGQPIVKNLRSGGSVCAHPLHLVIVLVLSSLFAVGFVFMVVDQWPCFLGVQNCD